MSIFNNILKKLKREEIEDIIDEEQKEEEPIAEEIIQKKIKEDMYRRRMSSFLSRVKQIG